MSKTMTEKLLTRASGKDAASVGDAVTAKIDVVSIPDSVVDDWLVENNLKAWDPRRVVFSFDHFLPRATEANVKWWGDVEHKGVCTEDRCTEREHLRHRQTWRVAPSPGGGGMGSARYLLSIFGYTRRHDGRASSRHSRHWRQVRYGWWYQSPSE